MVQGFEALQRKGLLELHRLMDSDPEPMFDAIVADAASLINTPMSMISLVDDRRQWFKAKLGTARSETSLEQSICAHAVRGAGVFTVPDAQADRRFCDMDAVRDEGGIRFYAGAPLRMRDGVQVGTICVVDVEPREGLSNEERVALETLARRTVAAIELRSFLAQQGPDGPYAERLLEHALDSLVQASASLERLGETATIARLEEVIANVDDALARHRCVEA